MKLLFINACSRERGVSRTLALCDAFIESFRAVHPDTVTEELDLFRSGISYCSAGDIARRELLIREGRLDDAMFDRARDFAEAGCIVVGAPCWDLSFPAVLKAYIESICACRITFRYTETGSEGLCAFRNFVYLTSCGGYLGDNRFGADYMEGIAHFLGHGRFVSRCAEGLDIAGNDAPAILSAALREVRALARTL